MSLREAVVNTLREQLREQQRAFAQRVINGVADSVDGGALVLKKSAQNRFSDSQRLQIYRNNFVISLREALAGVYPVIHKLLGDEFFEHAAREYSQTYPSRTGNVHDFGDVFSTFLQDFPGLESLPYLPDVARLEWAYHRVFHTQETKALNIGALSTLNETQLMDLEFELSSSFCHLASEFPILHIWQSNQSGHEPEKVSLDEGGIKLVVVRHGQQIEFHPISDGVFALVKSLSRSETFLQACGEALKVESDCDVGMALQFLVEQKIVCGFSITS